MTGLQAFVGVSCALPSGIYTSRPVDTVYHNSTSYTRKMQTRLLSSVFVSVVGASAARPTLVVKTENCLYIYIYIWYIRILYMHAALFVRDAILPHCTLNHCLLKRQDYRKAEQWESTQQGLENGEDGGTTSETETDY